MSLGFLNKSLIGGEKTWEGLFAYYRLNGDVKDSVGGLDGITTTTHLFENGKNGLCSVFNNNDTEKIRIPHSSPFSFTDGVQDKPFSISFWVKFKTYQNQWIISKRDGAGSNTEWQIILYQNKIGIYLFGSNWKFRVGNCTYNRCVNRKSFLNGLGLYRKC